MPRELLLLVVTKQVSKIRKQNMITVRKFKFMQSTNTLESKKGKKWISRNLSILFVESHSEHRLIPILVPRTSFYIYLTATLNIDITSSTWWYKLLLGLGNTVHRWEIVQIVLSMLLLTIVKCKVSYHVQFNFWKFISKKSISIILSSSDARYITWICFLRKS